MWLSHWRFGSEMHGAPHWFTASMASHSQQQQMISPSAFAECVYGYGCCFMVKASRASHMSPHSLFSSYLFYFLFMAEAEWQWKFTVRYYDWLSGGAFIYFSISSGAGGRGAVSMLMNLHMVLMLQLNTCHQFCCRWGVSLQTLWNVTHTAALLGLFITEEALSGTLQSKSRC